MLGPIIEGDRVRLIPPTEEMLPTYIRWFADTRVTRYLHLRFPPSMGQEKEWLEKIARSDNDIVWAVVLRETEKHIGSTGIHRIDWPNRKAMTGTVIGDTDEWGKGYNSEVVQLRTRYAFTQMTLEKLQTEVIWPNIASRRCLEKAGYVQYGLARHHEWSEGAWHDMWLAEILRDEWVTASV